MSRPDINWYGTIPTNVDPQQVINHLSIAFDQGLTLYAGETDWVPPDSWISWGEINLSFEDDGVYYSFTGQADEGSAHDFLTAMEPLATGGWESREGSEDDQDEDCIVFRGPNPKAIALANLTACKLNLAHATEALTRARKAYDEHQ